MSYTSHLVTRFMAAGAEQCLDDYHFIRNTHDIIHDQEAQLNRILRMLNQDEVLLNWHIDKTPIGRSRSQTRSYKFDRAGLPGNIAYLRLREREQEEARKRSSSNFTPTRTYERRQRISEQGNHSDSLYSAARQRAFADYDTNKPIERYRGEKSIVDDEKYRQQKKEKPVIAVERHNNEKLATLNDKYHKSLTQQSVTIDEKYSRAKAAVSDDKYSRKKPSIDEQKSAVDAGQDSKKTLIPQDELLQKPESVSDAEKRLKAKTAIVNEKQPMEKLTVDQQKSLTAAEKSPKEKLTVQDEKSQKEKLVTDDPKPAVSHDKHPADKSNMDEQDSHTKKPADGAGKQQQEKSTVEDEKKQKQESTADKKKSQTQKAVADADKRSKEKPVVPDNEHPKEKPATDNPKPAVSTEKHSADKPNMNEEDSHTKKPADGAGKQQQEKSTVQDEEKQKQESIADKKKSQTQKPAADADKRSKEKPVVNDDEHPKEKPVVNDQNPQTQQQTSDTSKQPGKNAVLNEEKYAMDAAIVADEEQQREKAVPNTEQKESMKKDTEKKSRKAKTSVVEATALKEEDNDDDTKAQGNNLASFIVRYSENSSSNPNSDDQDPLGYIICEWTSPDSPTSALKSYTIERQCGDQQWLPVGETIDKRQTQAEFDLSSLLTDDKKESVPSRFRLKALLKNGKTWTSKPTDEVDMVLLASSRFISPNVEVLTDNSVQLTWTNDESKQAAVYDVEKKDKPQGKWAKVSKVALSQCSAFVDNLSDAQQCQFRLVPSKTEADNELEVLTVQNVNEWLSSLRLEPLSANIVDIDISAEGFKEFDQYKVEYAAIDQPDQWKQVSNITRDAPHLTVDKLSAGIDYKFRLTPIQRGATAVNDTTSSQLSLVLDVKMPLTRKGRLIKNEVKTTAPPTQFAVHQTNPTSVFIEAILPTDKPALFEDVFEVYSKKEVGNDDWVKVGTIDKDHLSMTIKNLPENTAYTFKIHNQTTPSSDEQNHIVQEFNFETASVKLYDPSIFLEKVQKNLENVVDGVMKAAAGHQTLEESVNVSLNDVIRKIFLEEDLVPNEQYGFDTLALSDDLQLFRGPKQMLLQELEENKPNAPAKNEGEIIIHNYRQSGRDRQPVIVREESGNTRIGNIDGDVIIRNVVTDVVLNNEEKRNQLSMNIVGQGFLKRVQGTLIASSFKGIIVVKNVDRP